ncbi:MAG TPA: fatty acid desaturase, partial [Planctomycetaceae bacterium]|nr:fatty acid desaturase [Planctomycetaceae bacterium]
PAKRSHGKKRRSRKNRVAEERPVPARAVESQEIYDWFNPSQLNWKNVDWVVVGWMAAMHVGCLAAPFFFTWSAFGLAAVIYWLTSSVGVCLGYHRYLTHRSFKLAKPAEFGVLLCSVGSGEGSPLMWAATHRLHHQRSDQEGDPHSPLEGKWWSHMAWLFVNHSKEQRDILYRRYVPDLVDQPVMKFFERTYGLWLVAFGVALLAIGGIPALLWGMCVRMVISYHSTWFVNSATHLWGYRNYDTRDESRNLWWVALLAFGEGWHNNHHAHPSTARAGHQWWEIDMTFWVIRALQFVGLASDVNDHIPLGEKHEAPASV